MLLITILVVAAMLTINLLVAGLASMNGITEDSAQEDLILWLGNMGFKILNGAVHLFSFLIPSIIFLYLVYQRKENFSLVKKIDDWVIALLSVSWLFFSYPLIAYATQLNAMVSFPEWLTTVDEMALDQIKSILNASGPLDFILTIIVMAVLPAIGEELLFRGIIQREIEIKTRKPHLSIMVTSIVFSLFHMQVVSFMPKLIIGLILGYLFYWTRNLWIPVMVHFFNNALLVSLQMTAPEDALEPGPAETEMVPMTSLILSSILCALIVHSLNKRINEKPI